VPYPFALIPFVSGAAAWTPLDLGATLVRWYASTVTISSGHVATWTDETGNVDATSASPASTGPTASVASGHEIIAFDGTQFLDTSAARPFTSAGTIFGRFKTSSIVQYTAVMSKWFANTAWHLGGYQSSGSSGFLNFIIGNGIASPAVSDNALDDGAWHSFIATYQAPTVALEVDGVAQGTTGSFAGEVPDTADHIGIGAALNSSGGSPFGPFTGSMQSMGICDTEITGANRTQLRAYLASLPSP